MPYRFKHSETVPQNVKRVAAEQLDSAIKILNRKGSAGVEESIHEARKNIKKIRALLRMVRSELGSFYRDENMRLRDTGRKLSPLRDAAALIASLENLSRQKGSPPKKMLASIRSVFVLQNRQLKEQAEARALLPSLALELQKTRHGIRYWPLETRGFSALAPGIERTFRDGRKALAVARKTGRAEDFHELRKRVKDHWYHVRLLNRVWGDLMSGYQQSLKELESVLGEDVNLAVLERQVQQLPEQADARRSMSALHRSVESARKDLRRRALEIGDKVYAEKPREFVRQMKRLWKAW